MKCLARQYSDQMSCHRCGLTWDINDSDPPPCNQGQPVTPKAKPKRGHRGLKDALNAVRDMALTPPESKLDSAKARPGITTRKDENGNEENS